MRRLSSRRGVLVLSALDAALLVILLLTFLPSFRRNEPRSRDSALLNPGRVADIRSITVTAPDADGRWETVTLTRSGAVWTGTDSRTRDAYRWPADVQAVGGLIETAARTVRLFAKADGASAWSGLGVEDGSAMTLGFLDEAGEAISMLYFGRRDGLTRRLAVRSGADQAVYEVDDAISTYLTGGTAFWADPYLYPQCVTGYGRARSESFLRHGELLGATPAARPEPVRTVREDFDNGSRATLAIYQQDDGYVVLPAFTAGPAFSEEEKSAIEGFSYRYALSGWTYGRLFPQEGD